MKKTKSISLVLITAALASCHKQPKVNDWSDSPKVYMRSDTTAGYTYAGHGTNFLWYYAFRPYGLFYGGRYQHAGYYSEAIAERSNIGSSAFKGSVVRGGFGGSHSFSVSS
jgi:hypothetical protein